MEGFADFIFPTRMYSKTFAKNNETMESQNQTNHGRILLGLILVAIGVLYAFDYWRLLPNIREWIFSWGSLFLLIGVVNLASKRNPVVSGLFILAGAFFYIQEFMFGYRVGWSDIWPVALILIGLGMIFRAAGGRKTILGGRKPDPSNPDDPNQSGNSGSSFDDVAVFGGGDKVVNSDSFTGGKITAIFGGSDIDVTQAKIKNGPAVIDIFVIFGGTTIFAPKDWNVNVQLTPIFGGFSDKRFNIAPATNDPNKELVVKGLVLFGGGEIKGR